MEKTSGERGEHMSYLPKFEDIDAWQLARELTRKIYGLTKKVKFARDFGLKGQIQDAAGALNLP
jgi:hypothetical protein